MIKYLFICIFLVNCAERIELRAESKRIEQLNIFENCFCTGYEASHPDCHRHVLKERECQIIHETWKSGIFSPGTGYGYHELYTVTFDHCTQDYIMIGRCVPK